MTPSTFASVNTHVKAIYDAVGYLNQMALSFRTVGMDEVATKLDHHATRIGAHAHHIAADLQCEAREAATAADKASCDTIRALTGADRA